MKSFLRPILCGGILTALLCTPSLAAEQGDFTLLVNGEQVTFSDAAPVLKDGRSFLPMAATFEALGFPAEDMTWNGDTQTAAASKDGTTISLTIGKNAIQVTQAGAEAGVSIGTDAAPYIDPASNRTYIPVGLVADALGYRVGWDPVTSTVIIDDVDAILAENTETYQLMDQYMEYAKQYSQGTYAVDGSYQLSMSMSELAGQAGSSDSSAVEITNTVGGDYSMVTNQTAMQFETTLNVGGTIMGAPISPMELEFDMRGDLKDGQLYLWFQSEELEEMLGTTIPDQWYSLDMKALYDQVYGPGFYEELIAMSTASVNSDATFAQTLEEILGSDMLPLTSQFTTKDYLNTFNLMLGDSHFQKSGSTYTSTLEQDGARIDFILYTSAGKVNGYGMELTAADAASGLELTMTLAMKGDDMSFLFEMPGLTMEMDGAYKSTSTAPVTQPPAGAQVVDLMDMLTGAVEAAPQAEAM